jgi:hypothetical protein
MEQEKYNQVLAQAKENGLVMHPSISRKCINGVHGMYASGDISANELLVSYPVKQLIHVDPSVQYPKEFIDQWKYIHAAAKSLTEKEDNWFYFDALYDIDFFKGFHAYFCEQEELDVLKTASPLLYQHAMFKKTELAYISNLILGFDDSISPDALLLMILNHQCRAWGDVGFVPVLDLFNHSDDLGSPRNKDETSVVLHTKKSYKAGDQIWISYGKKDIHYHALNFGYFDPNDKHVLDLGYRAAAVASTSQQKLALKSIEKHFKVRREQLGGNQIEYKLHPNQVFFEEKKPTQKAIEYMIAESRGDVMQQGHPVELLLRSRQRLMGYLNSFNDSNKVELTSEKDFPAKLAYLYHMLLKEKTMIEDNMRWLSENPNLG